MDIISVLHDELVNDPCGIGYASAKTNDKKLELLKSSYYGNFASPPYKVEKDANVKQIVDPRIYTLVEDKKIADDITSDDIADILAFVPEKKEE